MVCGQNQGRIFTGVQAGNQRGGRANDAQQVQTLVQMTCTLLIAAPLTAIGGLVMALREDVELTWILAVAIPVLVLSIGTVIRNMIPTFRRMQDRTDDINRVLREQITGIRVVRAFVREPYETERFEGANDALTQKALRGGRLMGLMFPTVIMIVNVWATLAGRIRDEKPMTETPYDAAADRPLAPQPAE